MAQPIAFVLLDRHVVPDMNAVAAAIRARHPDVPVEVAAAGEAGQAAGSPLISCAGQMVVVMSIPAALPRDEGVLDTASRTWPQAKATFARHRAHLIVSTLGASENRLPVVRAMTAVIGAIMATVPVRTGVLWSRVAVSAEHWLQMSPAAFAPYPSFPFMLWVGIYPFRDGALIGAVTYGLASFVGREIELEGNGADLSNIIDKVAGLTAYLIERGEVIPDGHTFGGSETERLALRHATSRRFANLPVLLATCPAA
jgi:hypothetical protein